MENDTVEKRVKNNNLLIIKQLHIITLPTKSNTDKKIRKIC